ncbi:ZIP family metal transporter [Clostridium estertheticum]|uniref:ZIP family metal transporter n=1 Tax=Clostridium estertheticum TaxID=238834 RepID=UPI001CF18918|nr:ZIP family metal transporter [Clostridium estertheticum]MCB2361253.1 ZIP family metal transporter [Clostridium estertheticum]
MLTNFNLLVHISNIGFFTAWIGTMIGILLCFITTDNGRRFKGTVLGFLGGLMLAIICFDLIPEAFESGNAYIATIGIFIGLITALLIDSGVSYLNFGNSDGEKQRYLKVALFMAIGSGIHNIPAGIALGSLLNISYTRGLQLAIALLLHGIPEGLTLGMYLKEGEAKIYTIILFSIFTSIPMGIGALMGGILNSVSPIIICISLSFAAGLILYTVCKEIIPESIGLWRGRLSASGTVLGIIVGKIFVSIMH